MTKADLIEKMAMDSGVTKAAAAAALDAMIAGITAALRKDDGKITLTGFGTFSKVWREARKGRNPQTGEEIQIKARTSVKFKAGKNLNESVQE